MSGTCPGCRSCMVAGVRHSTPHEIGLAAKREAQEKYADRGLVAQALMAFYAYCDARRDAEEANTHEHVFRCQDCGEIRA